QGHDGSSLRVEAGVSHQGDFVPAQRVDVGALGVVGVLLGAVLAIAGRQGGPLDDHGGTCGLVGLGGGVGGVHQRHDAVERLARVAGGVEGGLGRLALLVEFGGVVGGHDGSQLMVGTCTTCVPSIVKR